MKFTKNEIFKILGTMIICFAAAAIYYFVYSIDVDSAHTLGVLCLGITVLRNYKTKNKQGFLHTKC